MHVCLFFYYFIMIYDVVTYNLCNCLFCFICYVGSRVHLPVAKGPYSLSRGGRAAPMDRLIHSWVFIVLFSHYLRFRLP
jgi:hypothetical protein